MIEHSVDGKEIDEEMICYKICILLDLLQSFSVHNDLIKSGNCKIISDLQLIDL